MSDEGEFSKKNFHRSRELDDLAAQLTAREGEIARLESAFIQTIIVQEGLLSDERNRQWLAEADSILKRKALTRYAEQLTADRDEFARERARAILHTPYSGNSQMSASEAKEGPWISVRLPRLPPRIRTSLFRSRNRSEDKTAETDAGDVAIAATNQRPLWERSIQPALAAWWLKFADSTTDRLDKIPLSNGKRWSDQNNKTAWRFMKAILSIGSWAVYPPALIVVAGYPLLSKHKTGWPKTLKKMGLESVKMTLWAAIPSAIMGIQNVSPVDTDSAVLSAREWAVLSSEPRLRFGGWASAINSVTEPVAEILDRPLQKFADAEVNVVGSYILKPLAQATQRRVPLNSLKR